MSILTGDFVQGVCVVGLDPSMPLTVEAAAGARPADEDLALYLRHIEGGETIRAIAREVGCHPSTIMRRIRRFEARRDDPLVDRGADRAAQPAALNGVTAREGATGPGRVGLKQMRRVLRRLAEPGAEMVVADGMAKAIIVRDEIRTAILDRELAEIMAMRGWIIRKGEGRLARYVLSVAGRALLRRALRGRQGPQPNPLDFDDAMPVAAPSSPTSDPGWDHADQHRIWDEREIIDPEDGRRRRARVNIAESPLLVLARRRDHNGAPFLTPDLVAAGERLREDYELAQMGPRITQSWDRFLTAGIDVSGQGSGRGGGSDTARNRVAAALRELGPGMGDMCLRVCCFLEGIEMTERRLGWSARSGKIVLRLGLMRLERHYREEYGDGALLVG